MTETTLMQAWVKPSKDFVRMRIVMEVDETMPFDRRHFNDSALKLAHLCTSQGARLVLVTTEQVEP